MKHIEGRFKGYKNLSLYYQCWLPATNPKAILLIVNGMAEHSGRYTNLVSHFVANDYAVYGYDHRGHGRSEGVRCHVDRFEDYLLDLEIFFNIVNERHPDKKIFLFGHSMGGLIVATYAVRHQQEMAGLLLCGATLKVGSSISPILIAIAPLLSLLLPKLGVTSLDSSALSQDKAVVDAYLNDPLVYQGKIRARLGAEILKTMQKLPRRMTGITLPILIMYGTADQLSEPEGSRMLYGRVGSKDKTLKLYEGFYHEIFNEPGCQQVFTDMEAWLSAHI